jgi:hypothetical protein
VKQFAQNYYCGAARLSNSSIIVSHDCNMGHANHVV